MAPPGMETYLRKRILDMVLPGDRIVVGLFVFNMDGFCNLGRKLSPGVCEKRFPTNPQFMEDEKFKRELLPFCQLGV
ncbi:MAG: hypothetical protein OXC82_00665 [Rhodobacteraceae bacterium]|nr:hypothetical protein [Paracoccaceae bacterium]MCY4248939.1 hypothetical protein [Paracoccaceae bacterium]